MRIRSLIYLFVTAMALVLSGSAVFAQVAGSPLNDQNAIKHRYQKYNRTLPSFGDSVKFRDRFYTTFSAGVGTNWEESVNLKNRIASWTGRLTLGYRLSPVHAMEADIISAKAGENSSWGINLNYAMNLNNFATRKDNHNRFEAILLSGVSYSRTSENHFGVNAGMRLQYNTGLVTGFFVEPRLNILSGHSTSASKFITQPQIMAGFTLRFHKPRYYAWDYLTPFAIKTNMLYDAITAANVGIEIPIREKWSVGFEWICPWWSNYREHRYMQLLHGSIEAKYWLGKRENKAQLTGWFAGVTLGGGYYDFMFEDVNGIQGEEQSIGLIAGFAHAITKDKKLRLEYAVGVGYLGSNYRKYYWDGYDYSLTAPSPQSWNYTLIGPIKAQISLVYWLKLRSKVGGRE